MAKNNYKKNTLKLPKILSAICAVISLSLIIIFIASNQNTLPAAGMCSLPVLAAVLIYCKKEVLVLMGGIISGSVGAFTLANQIAAMIRGSTSPWIFCITLTFTFCLLTSGILVLIWYKNTKSRKKPRRRFRR